MRLKQRVKRLERLYARQRGRVSLMTMWSEQELLRKLTADELARLRALMAKVGPDMAAGLQLLTDDEFEELRPLVYKLEGNSEA